MLPEWVTTRLACPHDHRPLSQADASFACPGGHRFPVRDGIPILLRDDVEPTHDIALHALRGDADPEHFRHATGPVDPFVQEAIGATGGLLYADLAGRLTRYPIPALRLPPGGGRTFLDIGCSWGRWTIAAARLGYRALGIDPSLAGIRAARRVAGQLGVEATYLVADARHLPFVRQRFDTAFSYSVLQHFSKPDARRALGEIGRVLTPGGTSLIQLPNAFGLRSLYQQLRRGLREPRRFEVRYWTVPELRRAAEEMVGPSTIATDGFFSLNPQSADADLLSTRGRLVVALSELLRSVARAVPPMTYVADSLYVTSHSKPDSAT
jgi:SAM-dependent methyltransferase